MGTTDSPLEWSPVQQRVIRTLIGAETHGHDDVLTDREFFVSVLTRLRLLINADEVTAVTLDTVRRRVTHIVGVPHRIRIPREASFHASFWNDCWDTATYPPVRQPARLRRARLHGVLGTAVTRAFTLFTSLPVGDETDIRVVFFRRSQAFSESERLMLNLLAPYLLAGYRRTVAKAAQMSLTRRQREVILLAARGYNGGEIAALLQLSPGTVRKHFDNIYERLGAPNRIVAVARAFPHGIPSAHPDLAISAADLAEAMRSR